MMSREQRAYLTIMVDSIRRKNELLSDILVNTEKQSELLKQVPMDEAQFNALLQEKEACINQINEIDEGFDALYRRIEQQLVAYKNECKEEILTMQELIREVTKKSMSVQALEKKNSVAFKLYMTQQKKQLRQKKMSSEIANNYYKNFAKQNVGMQSIFLDKKK